MRHMVGKGIFVTGTDTDVGKTEVTAGLAALLQQRYLQSAMERNSRREPFELAVSEQALTVRLWKPVQSGALLGSPDADSFRLLHGSGLPLREADIATHTYTAPIAPWLAACRAGTPLVYSDLVAEGKRRLRQGGCLLVEGAGGLLVPLAESKRMVDLAADLELPLIIVARAGLGTVNHTLLTIAAAQEAGLEVLGVILNGSTEQLNGMARDNAMMIERFSNTTVLGILPWLNHSRTDKQGWDNWRQQWTALMQQNLQLDRICNYFAVI